MKTKSHGGRISQERKLGGLRMSHACVTDMVTMGITLIATKPNMLEIEAIANKTNTSISLL